MERRPGEIRSLTGLRGVAAGLVVVYHCSSEQHGGGGPLRTALDHGYLMVDLFFVLSGFVAARSYAAPFRGGPDRDATLRFLGRRLARLWPGYLLALALAVMLARLGLIDLPFERRGTDAVLANLFMVQSWGLAESFDGPAWSVSAEWAACLLFPLLAPACLFRSRAAAAAAGLLAVAGLCALSATPTAWLQVPIRGGALDIYAAATPAPVLRCLCGFVLGLLAFRVARVLPPEQARGVPELASFGILAGMAVPIPDVGIVLLCVVLITTLPLRRDGLARWLGRGGPRWFGQRSYPLYLLHFLLLPAMRALASGLAARGVPGAPWLALGVFCGVAALLAHAVHYGVERPCRAALLALLDGHRVPTRWKRPAPL